MSSGILTINEARARLNRPPLADAAAAPPATDPTVDGSTANLDEAAAAASAISGGATS